MNTIYKYPLPWPQPGSVDWRATVSMPRVAQLLSAQEQHGQVVLWAHVDPTTALVERHFRMCMTGESLDASFVGASCHIATVQLRAGALVVHVFEVFSPAKAGGA